VYRKAHNPLGKKSQDWIFPITAFSHKGILVPTFPHMKMKNWRWYYLRFWDGFQPKTASSLGAVSGIHG